MMNIIKEYKEFANVQEDKIYSFSEYKPKKYNGNVVIDQIMEWLRAKLLDEPSAEFVSVSLEQFFSDCAVNYDEFMTFYNELDKTQRVKSFQINIENNIITFSDFKNNEEKE